MADGGRRAEVGCGGRFTLAGVEKLLDQWAALLSWLKAWPGRVPAAV